MQLCFNNLKEVDIYIIIGQISITYDGLWTLALAVIYKRLLRTISVA